MTQVLLTISCATQDAEVIATILRDAMSVPVHVRREDVFGHDFDDAQTSERVIGALTRSAIELELPQARTAEAIEEVRVTRRRLPFRWRTVAVIERGRIA